MGVVQRCGHLGLGPEPAQEPAVVGKGPVQDLDRHPPAQPDVVGEVDAAAGAGTDGREQPVSAGEDATDEVDEGGVGHVANQARATEADSVAPAPTGPVA